MKSKSKKILLVIIAVVVLVPLGFMALNKGAPISWGLWGPVNASSGVAIRGYDPVAYHVAGAAQKGDPAIAHRWQDVAWHFASQENKALFAAAPEKYAPEFGGYCAKAVASGITLDADPEAWHIQDGKLYLFFGEDPKIEYLAEIGQGVIARSEENWAER